MRVVAIVQARLGSTRLPAKVLLDLAGKTALERCLLRVRRIVGVDEVVLATTVQPVDALLVTAGERLGVRVVRGSAEDVLARYVDAARAADADVVVRVTSDCPLLDPELSALVVAPFRGPAPPDYAANTLGERRLPRGLDTEALSREALERAHRDATEGAEREHVTAHLYRRPAEFRLHAVASPRADDLSAHRWTLDTLADYHLLATLFDELGASADHAGLADVLAILARRPELAALNADVAQKAL